MKNYYLHNCFLTFSSQAVLSFKPKSRSKVSTRLGFSLLFLKKKKLLSELHLFWAEKKPFSLFKSGKLFDFETPQMGIKRQGSKNKAPKKSSNVNLRNWIAVPTTKHKLINLNLECPALLPSSLLSSAVSCHNIQFSNF